MATLSSIEFITLPPAVPQIRRAVSTGSHTQGSRTSGTVPQVPTSFSIGNRVCWENKEYIVQQFNRDKERSIRLLDPTTGETTDVFPGNQGLGLSLVDKTKDNDNKRLIKAFAQPKITVCPLTPVQIATDMQVKVFTPVKEIASAVIFAQNKAHGRMKEILIANAELIRWAREEFGAKGRHVPVPGTPSYGEWLKASLTVELPDGGTTLACSDRYVRKVMADLDKQLSCLMKEQLELPPASKGGGTDDAEGEAESKEEPSGKKPTNRDEIKSSQELLSEFAATMEETLTGKSVLNDAMRIKRAAEKVKDLQRALDEGKLFDAAPIPVAAPEPEAKSGSFVEGEPVPLYNLADELMAIADELRCAHCLDGFADQIDDIGEEVLRREELDRRMAKAPARISGRWWFKSARRDRRYQEDMRLIRKAGGTTYRGKKILGGDDPYIVRFSRKELLAELRNDLQNQLGVTGTRDPIADFYRTRAEADKELCDKEEYSPVEPAAPEVDEVEKALMTEAGSTHDDACNDSRDAVDAEAATEIEPEPEPAPEPAPEPDDGAAPEPKRRYPSALTVTGDLRLKLSPSEAFVFELAQKASIKDDLAQGLKRSQCTGEINNGWLVCGTDTPEKREWIELHIIAIWNVQYDVVRKYRKQAALRLSERLYAALKEVEPDLPPFDFAKGTYAE